MVVPQRSELGPKFSYNHAMTKKANRPRGKAKSSAPKPPPFSRLGMDQTMANLQKLLADKDFESIDEINAFLHQTLEARGGQLPEFEPATPLEQAQALVAQAYELTSPTRRRELARQALALSADCADAYSLLAELEPTPIRRLEWLDQGAAAGRRALGDDAFRELAGHFWGHVETRPFMRAYAGVAELSWALGDRARAIEIYGDMLRLNPNDNQGVRYMFATCLLEDRTPRAQAALQELLNRFPDDGAANWAYNRALLFFQLKGQPTDMANQALRDAMEANIHVPPLLLGEKQLPREIPQYVGMGDVNEAVEYVAFAHDAWRQTSGALPWLRKQRQP
jgi:tetratricopeptide (TPR) repeat protein